MGCETQALLAEYAGLTLAEIENGPGRHMTEMAWWREHPMGKHPSLCFAFSSSYLFATAANKPFRDTSKFPAGRVLDFGAGAGVRTLQMAKEGRVVDYYDISLVSQAFMRWCAAKLDLPIHVLSGDTAMEHPALGRYGLIIAIDVMSYPGVRSIWLPRFRAALVPGGMLTMNSSGESE